MKNIPIYLLVISILFSCKKQAILGDMKNQNFSQISIRESKLYIAKTLANAIQKEPLLRSFIKLEALKQFDNDYDVFYHSVKDINLADGETFYAKLAKYANSKDSLDSSIKMLPLLTILVPELPRFSAERWDVVNDIPSVAVEPESYSSKENIIAFHGEHQKFDIPYGLLPAEATIVIKDNERIILNNKNITYGKSDTKNSVMSINQHNVSSNTFLTTEGMSFSFGDQVFNGLYKSNKVDKGLNVISSINKANTTSDRPPRDDVNEIKWTAEQSIVQHVVNAKNSGAEWQRDNIYYGIDPSNNINNGPLKRNISECLTAIRFIDGPLSHGQIGTNPSDPHPVDGGIWQEWTNGSYEFRLTALINSKNGPGIQTQKVFYVKPSDLFLLDYEEISARPPATVYLRPFIKQAKLYRIPDPAALATWDLENVSFGWKILLTKYNPQQTTVTTVGNTTEYATNFEFNATIGDKEKIGAKFGSSTKYTNTQTYSYSKTVGPQDLGDADLFFDNPVFLSYEAYTDRAPGSLPRYKYIPYELNLGSVLLTIEPRKQY